MCERELKLGIPTTVFLISLLTITPLIIRTSKENCLILSPPPIPCASCLSSLHFRLIKSDYQIYSLHFINWISWIDQCLLENLFIYLYQNNQFDIFSQGIIVKGQSYSLYISQRERKKKVSNNLSKDNLILSIFLNVKGKKKLVIICLKNSILDFSFFPSNIKILA